MKKIYVITTLNNAKTNTVVNKSIRNYPFSLSKGETVQLVNKTENVSVTATVTETEITSGNTYSVFSVFS